MLVFVSFLFLLVFLRVNRAPFKSSSLLYCSYSSQFYLCSCYGCSSCSPNTVYFSVILVFFNHFITMYLSLHYFFLFFSFTSMSFSIYSFSSLLYSTSKSAVPIFSYSRHRSLSLCVCMSVCVCVFSFVRRRILLDG